jgi:hypothetical protein
VGGGSGAMSFGFDLRRCLPERCYLHRAEHTTPSVGAVNLGQNGGPSSTSVAEALLWIRCWSSSLLRHQVVRPRWLGGDQWLRFFVGRERSSCMPLFLGGDALRTPARGGGDTQGPDCVLSFRSRVFSVIPEALSSNSRFLNASDVKGLLCKCTRHVE